MARRKKLRRYPFSSTIYEDVSDALNAHCRKTDETVVDFMDRMFRKGLAMPARPKEETRPSA